MGLEGNRASRSACFMHFAADTTLRLDKSAAGLEVAYMAAFTSREMLLGSENRQNGLMGLFFGL